MIHEIGVELAAALKAKRCPVTNVIDGPEGTATTTWGRERIVLEYDADGDTFGPPLSRQVNPQQVMVCLQGMILKIYTQSVSPGALPFEHRRRARHILDLVLVALYGIAKQRMNNAAIKSGRFFTPPDLAQTLVDGGAAYELKFSFDRGVFDRTWAGEARPEFELAGGSINSKTQVLGSADTDDEPETACGA